MAEKGKRLEKLLLYAFFWPIWRERSGRAFENCESFLYLFLDWIKLYIEDESMSLLDFVDWLGSPKGVVAYFCVFAPFGFCCFVYIMYTFLIQYPFTYPRKKKNSA